jgi:hypothetical protein
MNQHASSHYYFPRSLPHGSLPFRQFSVSPRGEVQESSGWAWFGMGMIVGALLLSACLVGA